MKKQIQLPLFFIFSLNILFIQNVNAKQDVNLRDVAQSLQSEYQSQLKNTHLHSKARKKRSRNSKKAKLIQQYQRFLAQIDNKQQRKAKKRKVAPNTVVTPNTKASASSVDYKKSEKPDTELLFNAASSGNVNEIANLLQQGVNINAYNSQKETALHMAAARGHYSTVIFLINNGANPFARTVKQWLPIHHATRFRHANIVRYLMQKGLSPNFRTSEGYSSIDMARTNHDRQLLNIFGAR